MKKLFFLLVILLSSCYCDWDLNNYPKPTTRADEYYWYYNSELFYNRDSCQVIGVLTSNYDNESYNINRRCKVYNDTIYIEKRRIAGHHNYFKGVILLKNQEPILIETILK